MKKFTITVLLILTLAASMIFTSCGELPTEEDVISAAKSLIPESVVLNGIYFGEGLPHEETAGASIMYATVSADAPYRTEDELRAATLDVFTENYANSLFTMYLAGYSDEGTGDVIYPRYVQYEDRLTVNVKVTPMIEDLRTYDLESIEVTGIKKTSAVVSVDSICDGEPSVTVEITLRLVSFKDEEGNVTQEWRIDSPTY